MKLSVLTGALWQRPWPQPGAGPLAPLSCTSSGRESSLLGVSRLVQKEVEGEEEGGGGGDIGEGGEESGWWGESRRRLVFQGQKGGNNHHSSCMGAACV